jgi:uroporphyrinogen decarboxylase
MTPRERVLLAIDHQETDRVPIQTYLTPEVHQALVDHFGRQPHEVFEVDFRGVGPRYMGPPGKPNEFSRGDAEAYDEWGVGYSTVHNPSGGAYMEATDLALARIETMDDVERYPWPSADSYDYSVIPEQIEQCRPYCVCTGGAGTPDIINGVSRGRGMEQVLCDIGVEDEVGCAVIDRRVDFYYELSRRSLEAGGGKIDILWTGEDLGSQIGPTMSPATFDRFFRPRLQRFYELAHEFGAKAVMHSCGSTRLLQSRLIDMGLDVLDAVQPEPVGMDPEELKREFGDRLTYCGLISTQQTLPRGTVEQCREEARHRLRVMARGGGYIFAPAHCIQPDTPLENVIAIYEEALGRPLV